MYQCDSMDNGAKLYKYFGDLVKIYIQEKAIPQVKSQNGIMIIKAYLQVWKDFSMFVKLLDRMFDYLNRYYLKN